ncbi:vitamin K epoxide reductase complex subunit 1-like protein 1 [Limulus polyphemus]|uniref:vitamin-K-epoxide reductase (warfarin-sensitive) n=1 Tax=Limulus polyphemus TaxID=6850 RepID=A0ABM1BFR9_LIMPO|nr:vitamin K epoxide reductase complex subunit 1-like protein 1 [Limulus polyphemus]
MAAVGVRLRKLRMVSAIICVLGLILSFYAYYVEMEKEHNKNYKALCDISDHMSCSTVFTSKYGRGFGLLSYIVGSDSQLNIPNSLFGIVFYILQMALGQSTNPFLTKVEISSAFVSNLGSLYLAYILYFILHDFCVLCVSTYVVNALLLACACYKLGKLQAVRLKQEKKEE